MHYLPYSDGYAKMVAGINEVAARLDDHPTTKMTIKK